MMAPRTPPVETGLRWPFNPSPLWLFVVLLFVMPLLPTFPRHGLADLAGDGKYFFAGGLAVVGACWTLRRIPPGVFKFATVLFFAYFFLVAFALLVDMDRVIVRDALELYKPLVAFSAFLFGVGVSYRSPEAIPAVWRGLAALLIMSLILGALELVNPSWGNPIIGIYKRASAILVRRPISFFNTTYFAASVYLFLGSLFTARAIVSRRLFPDLLLAFGAFVLVILTQSRAAFVALVLVVGWAVLLLSVVSVSDTWATLRRLCAVVVVSGALATYGTFYALENLPYLTTGVERYILNWDENLVGGGSLAVRAGQVVWAFENNPLIIVGAGIGKAYNPLLESWYALYYYRYGLVGILFYVGLWGWFWIYSLKHLQTVWATLGRDAASFLIGFNIFLIGLPALSVASVITDQVFLIPLYYGMLGVGYGIVAMARTASRERADPNRGSGA